MTNQSATLWVVLMIFAGTTRTIISASLLQTTFKKPVLITLLTFLAMSMCLLISRGVAVYRTYAKKYATVPQDVSSGAESTERHRDSTLYRRCVVFARPVVPAAFDVVGTLLSTLAMMYLPASLVELVTRGVELLCIALLTIFYRKRRLRRSQMHGVLLVLIGVTLVSFTRISLTEGLSRFQAMVGFALLCFRALMASLQDISEEVLLHDYDFSGMQLVGFEGAFGAVLCVMLLIPLSLIPGADDSLDAFSSPMDAQTCIALLLLGAAVLLLNLSNIYITQLTNALNRSVWKGVRICAVWMTGVLLHLADSSIGEAWSSDAWARLLGVTFVTGGVFLYSKRPTSDTVVLESPNTPAEFALSPVSESSDVLPLPDDANAAHDQTLSNILGEHDEP